MTLEVVGSNPAARTMGDKTHNPEKRKSYKKDGNKKGGKTIKETKEASTELADIDEFEGQVDE